jgi:hypothetical protein
MINKGIILIAAMMSATAGSITANAQAPVRAAALPVASAPVNDSDYVVGTHDSAGHNTTYKYPVKKLATYSSGSVTLAKALSNGATARQGYALGKVKSVHPYYSIKVGIDASDSSGYVVVGDSTGTNRITLRTDGGIAQISVTGSTPQFYLNSVLITSGAGSPQGAVTAVVGSLYLRTDVDTHILWVKETGTGNTGWVGK